MARLSREESRTRTRELLLASAARAFARSGFGGASVDVIAEEAGFSKGAFYSNFASKEAIFLALLEEHKLRDIALVTELVGKQADGASLTRALSGWLDTLNTNKDWALLAIELELHARRSATFAAEYEALQARFRKATADFVALVFERLDRVPPMPVEAIAATFIAIAHGAAPQAEAGSQDQPGHLARLYFDTLMLAAARR